MTVLERACKRTYTKGSSDEDDDDDEDEDEDGDVGEDKRDGDGHNGSSLPRFAVIGQQQFDANFCDGRTAGAPRGTTTEPEE